uniref:Serrate RNA effector molecule homolog n=1 Tax=Steinernema glaseri TaxID=37863 RepID=A0A1I7ZBG3_9BILA
MSEESARRRGDDRRSGRGDIGDRDRRSRDDQSTPKSNGSGMKRSGSRRDEGGAKRSRIDSACDTYEPQFNRSGVDEPTAPVMMTFKKFLATQDDSISDEDAIAKYSEYKMDFKRQELQKFFDAHKDEEWFRFKYHPSEIKKRKDEQKELIQKRLEIFNEFESRGLIDKIRLDFDNAREIIQLMDATVIKLEGGTDEDIENMMSEKIDDESVMELLQQQKADTANGEEEKPKEELETKKTETEEESTNGTSEAKDDGNADAKTEDKENDEGEPKAEGEAIEEGALTEQDERASARRRNMHKTCSIFLRQIPPSVTLAELEELCKSHPGYLRIGLSEPIADRKFIRRGWVSYRRDVNIKEICWNLNTSKIRDFDFGAIVNRDLTRRVRTTNGITCHRAVMLNDLMQAAMLVASCDRRAGLYCEENAPQLTKADLEKAVAQSKNPLMRNITEMLVDEGSAEEDELLGLNEPGKEDERKVPLVRDAKLGAFLDKLIIYLRLVHSIDFYNHGEYPFEDSMPNRCGMMHVRAQPTNGNQWGKNDKGEPLVPVSFVESFTKGFNERLAASLLTLTVLTDQDLANLGKKDPEKELEKFIAANSVELAKDKWLCPLSGKKFRGPEFIKKHLASKYEEQLELVKVEAEFFNCYIADPKRPHEPEPKPQPPPPVDDRRPHDGDRERDGGYRSSGYGGDRNRHSGRFGYSRPRVYEPPTDIGRRDPRQPVTYRDLDAPEDIF